MEIWPAIDLRGGKCVRLQQGDYARETVFGDDPAAMAAKWVQEGATCLHLVDLDGARDGRLENRQAVAAIVASLNIPCELGGGVRDEQAINDLLELGLSRLVVGTRALKEPTWFLEMCSRYPDKLVLGLDARDGKVATDGWLKTSDQSAIAFAQLFEQAPLAAIVYTDIARDGMMNGPNVAAMQEMKQAVGVPVVASGGVTNANDVQQLAEAGLDGCIIGRALYDGGLLLSEALHAAQEEKPNRA